MKEQNLIIVGAGVYGTVAKEIAQSMGGFDKIVFVDDSAENAYDGSKVVCGVDDIASLSRDYQNVIVAIGNPNVRYSLLQRIEAETSCDIVSLISPLAYVSPSAQLGKGCIIEPMAVVHAACKLGWGCIISAGAVINHASVLGECVHVDCNATVAGYADVPAKTKVPCGQVLLNGN